MAKKTSYFVFITLFSLFFTSCAIQQNDGKWVSDYISFDVGYSFGEGYYVGAWEISLDFAINSGSKTIYDSINSKLVTGVGDSFLFEFTYEGENIKITGKFTKSNECEGSTTFRGKTVNWVARPE